MSTSSIHRMKERGGAGSKIMAPRPSKSATPISEKSIVADALKKSSGKENPRPGSRVSAPPSQKPVIRAMPRIEKNAPAEAQTRPRRSTPTVPRGRSSSPSDFTRMLSDLRKQKAAPPRALLDRSEKDLGRESVQSGFGGVRGSNGARVLENIQQRRTSKDSIVKGNEDDLNGTGVSRKTKVSAGLGVSSVRKSEHSKVLETVPNSEVNERDVKDIRVLDDCIGAKLRPALQNDCTSSSREVGEVDYNSRVRSCTAVGKECEPVSSFLPKEERVDEKLGGSFQLGAVEKSLEKLNIAESSEEKRLGGDGLGVRAINKYPSKLHEKLAYLEGKVKRIASDIKQTKEMLDLNNPNESKVVLLDIQEKISGIEKAMGNVLSNSHSVVDSVRTKEVNDQQAGVTKSQAKPLEDVINSVKGMNSDELEARLLPHHKLLRDRTSQKAISNVVSHQPLSSASDIQSKEDKSSSLDDHPIALEFLASLVKEQLKDSTGGAHTVLESNEAHETDGAATSKVQGSSGLLNGKEGTDVVLTTDETIDEFEDQENIQDMILDEEEDVSTYPLNDIGQKTSTGGWFVSEGESVLLAHDDGSCSFYDIANCEGKAEYKPPCEVSANIWRDCWIVRAPGADGCSGRYVVAASAGNTMDSGFCSWDFYTKDVRAFHMEDTTAASRTVLGPLSNNIGYRRNSLSTVMSSANQQWWYKPCGPLIIGTGSSQRVVRLYDIRDGEQVMKWELQKPVLAMDYSSPLQWRNRGKVVIAETEAITLSDVSSLTPQALLSIPLGGRKISALHVNNTDAELGGGVRQRVSSSEAEGNDGVFCTSDSINVMDFRSPSGVGLKIPKIGTNAHSIFSRGDSIFLGCTNLRSATKKQSSSQVQHFSMRKRRLVSTYTLPESNAHSHYTTLTQVWGNSNFVMSACGLGLFIFDASKDDGMQSHTTDYGSSETVREVIGPDDLYSPSFDYSSSRVLLISRDRPALWRHLL